MSDPTAPTGPQQVSQDVYSSVPVADYPRFKAAREAEGAIAVAFEPDGVGTYKVTVTFPA